MGTSGGIHDMTTAERSLSGRIGQHLRWAKTPSADARREATQPARNGLIRRWEKQADPHGVMSPAELATAVESLKKAHYARMALASARARRGHRKEKAA